jgi:hypothetical protein
MLENSPDLSARLPDGSLFPFWDDKTNYTQVFYVNQKHINASDNNPGTSDKPFRSINAAAQIAEPGTEIIIYGGEYRETVKPAKGGGGDDSMIFYRAADGENVIIKASVEVKADQIRPSVEWFRPPHSDKIWQITIDPEDFKGYNPFCAMNVLHDTHYLDFKHTDMTNYLLKRGMVFVDGEPLKQVSMMHALKEKTGVYWVEANGQKIHFRLHGDAGPFDHKIEITNREQCFAPDVPFLSYIRVKNITCAHAATGAPIPQRGSISTYRGHHWIIEGCTVDWSNAVGIDCGNGCWHRPKAEGQILGYNIIRGNTIKDAGVCGIACFESKNLLIEDNLIDSAGWQRMELSWEAAGIKVHLAEDALFRRNILRNTLGGDSLWLDVDNKNCRITRNLFIGANDRGKNRAHIYMECNRDIENMIDNNILWKADGRHEQTRDGNGGQGWYTEKQEETTEGYGILSDGTDSLRIANNLIGKCFDSGYYAKAVAFRLSSGRGGTSRDNKILNNIFYECGEAAVKMLDAHNESEGNAYIKMPAGGGYLRILNPIPAMCLDLAAWRKFCGFDINGCAGNNIEIDIDADTFEMTVDVKQSLPDNIGPFGKLFAGAGKSVINIDPRKY